MKTMEFNLNDLHDRGLAVCHQCSLPMCAICDNGTSCPGCRADRCAACTQVDREYHQGKCPACYDRYILGKPTPERTFDSR